MPNFAWRHHILHYAEAGDPASPLLIVLPGSTASSANHGGELTRFSRSHRVAALDYLGTGRSDRVTPWPLDWWESGAEQAAALAAHLGAGRYALMGCGSGGTVALLAAAVRPPEVSAVVADSCPEKLTPADLRRIVARRAGAPAAAEGPVSEDAAATDRVRADGAEPPGEAQPGIAEQPIPGSLVEVVWRQGPRLLRRLVSPSMRSFWRQAHGDDWAEVVAADAALLLGLADRGGWDPLAGHLADIRCPVLLTSSLGDEEIPSVVAQHQHLATALSDCRLWVTPRGGHPAMWGDRRGFRRVAAGFLAQV